MKEEKQITFLIGTALFLCFLILGYAAFFASPVQLYTVLPITESQDESFLVESSDVSIYSNDSNEIILSDKININTATLLELTEIPGVGEVIAQRILEYRQKHHLFADIQELLDIDGIGQKKFEKMEPYVTINS